MKKILSFQEFVNETKSLEKSAELVPVNDIGYQLIFTAIEEHLNKPKDMIQEMDSLLGFSSNGEIKNFSTSIKGNFVLTLGDVDGVPACMLLDELNDVITYYI